MNREIYGLYAWFWIGLAVAIALMMIWTAPRGDEAESIKMAAEYLAGAR